jgi:hypothetical protein
MDAASGQPRSRLRSDCVGPVSLPSFSSLKEAQTPWASSLAEEALIFRAPNRSPAPRFKAPIIGEEFQRHKSPLPKPHSQNGLRIRFQFHLRLGTSLAKDDVWFA